MSVPSELQAVFQDLASQYIVAHKEAPAAHEAATLLLQQATVAEQEANTAQQEANVAFSSKKTTAETAASSAGYDGLVLFQHGGKTYALDFATPSNVSIKEPDTL